MLCSSASENRRAQLGAPFQSVNLTLHLCRICVHLRVSVVAHFARLDNGLPSSLQHVNLQQNRITCPSDFFAQNLQFSHIHPQKAQVGRLVTPINNGERTVQKLAADVCHDMAIINRKAPPPPVTTWHHAPLQCRNAESALSFTFRYPRPLKKVPKTTLASTKVLSEND